MKKQTWIKVGVMCAIIVAILVVDLVTKYVFDVTLADGETVTIIPHLIDFKLVHNMGAAWGMLAGKQLFLIFLSIVFLAIFIYYYVKEKNKTWLLTVAFGFLFAGCLGNLYDRIVLGYVRDFILFDFWKTFPIFNFADTFLCIGVVLFVIYLILYFVKANKDKGIKVEDFRDGKDKQTDKEDVKEEFEVDENKPIEKSTEKDKNEELKDNKNPKKTTKKVDKKTKEDADD